MCLRSLIFQDSCLRNIVSVGGGKDSATLSVLRGCVREGILRLSV